MTTANEAVMFVTDLANRGAGVNYDGAYGMQCVDLPNWICGKFFGKPLWGNAIDLL
ncbi:TPA: lysin, partial [Streptococcus suis]|nr:lysin [Streptococcus suis]